MDTNETSNQSKGMLSIPDPITPNGQQYRIGRLQNGEISYDHQCDFYDDGRYLQFRQGNTMIARFDLLDTFVEMSVAFNSGDSSFYATINPSSSVSVFDKSFLASSGHSVECEFQYKPLPDKMAYIGSGDIRPNLTHSSIEILSDAQIVLNAVVVQYNNTYNKVNIKD